MLLYEIMPESKETENCSSYRGIRDLTVVFRCFILGLTVADYHGTFQGDNV